METQTPKAFALLSVGFSHATGRIPGGSTIRSLDSPIPPGFNIIVSTTQRAQLRRITHILSYELSQPRVGAWFQGLTEHDNAHSPKDDRLQEPTMRFAFILSLAASAFAAETAPPNILFIIADDCTHRDLGCYGGHAHTPNIDKLAEQGMRFTQCFQTAPMCSTTRHNIYTGLYPVKSGAYPNHAIVKDGVKSVVHYLKPLGYRVALSGKTHIAPRQAFRFEYSGKKNPDMQVIDKLFADCAKSETPFCLFACSNEPHSPWDKGDASKYPPEETKLPPYFVDTPETRENMSKDLAEITYYDKQVGQCLELLERHKLTDNTMVVCVSEQGSGLPFAK